MLKSSLQHWMLSLGLLAVLLLTATATVTATPRPSLTVNSTSDAAPTSGNGFCTLREAIDNANSPGVDTTGGDCWVPMAATSDAITFSVSGTITLTSALPAVVNTSLTAVMIDGTGQSITVSGNSLYQVLYMNSDAPPLTLNDLTIVHGHAATGGGIYDAGGTLAITNSTLVDDNSNGTGGGGIFNLGTVTVTNSTLSSNSAGSGLGGGIFNEGVLTVNSSTLSNNNADANGDGGGIYGTAALANSILAANVNGNCVGGGVIDGGYNISDDSSCGFTDTGVNGDTIGDGVSDAHVGLDPAGLINNGGPSYTVGLVSGSYAVAAIPSGQANCPGFDQRGARRPAPLYTACDIGAFEYEAPVPTATATAAPAQAIDDFSTLSEQAWDAPATHAAAVTPSDLNGLSDVTRWLYVGGTGDIAVVMADGTTQTLPGLAAGTLLPIRVSGVMATGTTASAIVALW